MKISKAHKRFSERLENPRVLTNPEEFLGPNYKAVLNFWMILDELSEDQLKNIHSCYLDFSIYQLSEWRKAVNEAIKASEETIGRDFADKAADAAYVVYGWAAYRATRELIGMYIILEQNKPLTILNMFLNL